MRKKSKSKRKGEVYVREARLNEREDGTRLVGRVRSNEGGRGETRKEMTFLTKNFTHSRTHTHTHAPHTSLPFTQTPSPSLTPFPSHTHTTHHTHTHT